MGSLMYLQGGTKQNLGIKRRVCKPTACSSWLNWYVLYIAKNIHRMPYISSSRPSKYCTSAGEILRVVTPVSVNSNCKLLNEPGKLTLADGCIPNW